MVVVDKVAVVAGTVAGKTSDTDCQQQLKHLLSDYHPDDDTIIIIIHCPGD
jgi:uncharacterized membrane protein